MQPETRGLRRNWEQEVRLAAIYEALARAARTRTERVYLDSMAAEEREHAQAWQRLLERSGEDGAPPEAGPVPGLLAAGARVFGVGRMLALVGVAEGQILRGYMGQLGALRDQGAEDVLRHVISDESSHAGGLPAASDAEGQATLHGQGQSIRNVIYGVNDGLMATLGVLSGVAGATINPSVVLVGGLAAMTASGVSMAGSAYLASKSQREVFEEQVVRARSAIEAMPSLERRELEQIYMAKGLTAEEARAIVERITADKDVWLATQVREELGLDPGRFEDPVREARVAGVSTLAGGVVPIIAYLAAGLFARATPRLALLITFLVCLAALFLLGTGRSYFTRKGGFRSGLEMMLVGAVVAAVTFLVGSVFRGGV